MAPDPSAVVRTATGSLRGTPGGMQKSKRRQSLRPRRRRKEEKEEKEGKQLKKDKSK